ncbi:MAG: hypothetical protein A2W93_02330 [Bacteroidetes bacterium GWF2_43_63]|nr:MAG: hypothetical protein A2W94_13775 [Bacteroidetes bacterium GWE2_42_42]OFY53938.1 MAG: hypothetical protein A2W93_02330 [Bacteroidetes bacterium GWF2_43_63]HBG70582.1 hypothetical protein [Bacteroidales bacterium]HCB61234.1 hypothetical protein [Bacteroidales bacterium]HCY23685.1 hypothetical protein [Bacteroidales bacterium]
MKRIIISIFSLTYALMVFAQPGTPDASFGNNGIVITEVTTGFNSGNAVAIQADGKIVVVGESGMPGDYDMSFARYNYNGDLDNTFANSGILSFGVADVSNYASDVVIQPDGKIVAAGRTFNGSSCNIAVVRLNSDGSPDVSFASNGILLLDLGASEVIESVALQSDGKILVGGYMGTSSDDFTLMRINTNGAPDSTFGTNGVVTTQFGSKDSFIEELAVQSDGKIVAVGMTFDANSDYIFAAARYNDDGSPDASFGTTGKATYNVGDGHDFALAVCIQPDGKILLGGHSWITNSPVLQYDMAIVRINADGTLDNTFGTAGIATARIIDAENYAYGMVLQPDGKICLAGYTLENYSEANIALVRFNADGSKDNSFATAGVVTTNINAEDYASCVALQQDGKIVVAGYTDETYTSKFVVTRYNGDFTSIYEDNGLLFTLCPNPATDFVTIETNESVRIDVSDISGKIVLSAASEGHMDIDVSDFSKGLYIVKVQSENNCSISKLLVE